MLLPAFSLLRARGTPVLQKEGGWWSHPVAMLAPALYSKHAVTFLLTWGDRTAATGTNRQAEAQQRAGILFSLYLLQPEGVNCSSHSHDTEAAQRNCMFTENSRTALLSSLAGPLLQGPQQALGILPLLKCVCPVQFQKMKRLCIPENLRPMGYKHNQKKK